MALKTRAEATAALEDGDILLGVNLANVIENAAWQENAAGAATVGETKLDKIHPHTAGGAVDIEDVLHISGGTRSGGNHYIKPVCVNIGSWNMDTTPSIIVAITGMTATNFLGVSSCTILSDLGVPSDLFTATIGADTTGNYSNVGAGVITLSRASGGLYNAAGYSGASNRGYLTVLFDPVLP